MKEYPYIGKLKENNEGLVLFAGESFGAQLNSKGVGWYEEEIGIYSTTDKWDEREFTNITKEYLENKCVKILSPEHSEFVQKLAFKAGYSWNAGKNVALTDKEYLFFSGTRITWFWNNENSTEEIQLPMPPKDNLQEEDNVEKWKPVIGEKALTDPTDVVVTVAYFDKNSCGTDIALVFSDKKPFWIAKDDLKPLPKEDILLEEVITFLEDAEGLGSKVTAMGLVEKFNIEMKENK